MICSFSEELKSSNLSLSYVSKLIFQTRGSLKSAQVVCAAANHSISETQPGVVTAWKGPSVCRFRSAEGLMTLAGVSSWVIKPPPETFSQRTHHHPPHSRKGSPACQSRPQKGTCLALRAGSRAMPSSEIWNLARCSCDATVHLVEGGSVARLRGFYRKCSAGNGWGGLVPPSGRTWTCQKNRAKNVTCCTARSVSAAHLFSVFRLSFKKNTSHIRGVTVAAVLLILYIYIPKHKDQV